MLAQTYKDCVKIANVVKKVGPIALDTETTGLYWPRDELLGFSLAWRAADKEITTAYVPVNHPTGLWARNVPAEGAKAILRSLWTSKATLVFHNYSFDRHFLNRLLHHDWDPALDTQAVCRMLGWQTSTALLSLSQQYLGDLLGGEREREWLEAAESMKTRRKDLKNLPSIDVTAYAEADAGLTLRLAEVFEDRILEDQIGPLVNTEMRFVGLLARMEEAGIGVDADWAKKKAEAFQNAMATIEHEVGRADFGSNVGVARFLYGGEVGIPPGPATRVKAEGFDAGVPTVDSRYLEQYRHFPQVEAVLRWRNYRKAITAWLLPITEMASVTGRVHASFDPAGTISGRISCRNPNLQAIPMKDVGDAFGSMKGLFRAEPGHTLVEFDYDQAEVRLATILAGENRMAKVLSEGEDVHRGTAQAVWGKEDDATRAIAKRANFATIYAAGAQTVADYFHLPYEEAAAILHRHRSFFRGFPVAVTRAELYARQYGFIRLWTNRRRYFGPDEEGHKAFNQAVQGGVAELVKKAMLQVEKLLTARGTSSRLVLQIHDSIVVELADADWPLIPKVLKVMEAVPPRDLQEKVDPPVEIKASWEVWS